MDDGQVPVLIDDKTQSHVPLELHLSIVVVREC